MHFMLLFFFFAGKPDNKTHIYYQIVSYRYYRDRLCSRDPVRPTQTRFMGSPGTDRQRAAHALPSRRTHHSPAPPG